MDYLEEKNQIRMVQNEVHCQDDIVLYSPKLLPMLFSFLGLRSSRTVIISSKFIAKSNREPLCSSSQDNPIALIS